MEYSRFGNTGLMVSRACLGCLGFGDPGWREWILGEEAGRGLVRRALELGVNYFDTANVYSLGKSEEVLGRALKDMARRDEVVISTKVCYPMGPKPTQRGLSRKHIFEAIDASLKRLGTDYVDLYVIHRFDPNTPVEETVQALSDVVSAGKALYLGASSMYPWQFMKMLGTQQLLGVTKFVSMQCYLNLIYRGEETEMLPLCASEGIAVTPWAPLARGFLAAKEGKPPTLRAKKDNLATDALHIGSEQDHVIAGRVRGVARRLGVSPAVVALSWLYGVPGVTAVITGADAPEQIDEAAAALQLVLPPELRAELEEPYRHHHIIGLD